jgi:hypothetical protein
MKLTPNRHNLFVDLDSDDEFWVDDVGCLQPCPVCDGEDTRDATLIIAHHLCWATMPQSKRNHFNELRERLIQERDRDRDRYDDDDD